MKRKIATSIALLLLAGLCLAQGQTESGTAPSKNEHRTYSIDAFGNPTDSNGRWGTPIWNNTTTLIGGYLPMETGYLYLDWGVLQDQGNGMPCEVVDGFEFSYSSTNMDPGGESIAIYFYDNCTGWGGTGYGRPYVYEAGFFFSELPNAWPGGGQVDHTILVDLESTGYEFLLSDATDTTRLNPAYGHIGIGYHLVSQPVAGTTSLTFLDSQVAGNGTENAYDVYYPTGKYIDTYQAPSNAWGSFQCKLYGNSDPAGGMFYTPGTDGLAGNDASLYCVGNWAAGSSVRFRLKKNLLPEDCWLLVASGVGFPTYFPLYSATKILTGVHTVLAMHPIASIPGFWGTPYGDFEVYDRVLSPYLAGKPPGTYYFQGAITNYYSPGPLIPVDLSGVINQ